MSRWRPAFVALWLLAALACLAPVRIAAQIIEIDNMPIVPESDDPIIRMEGRVMTGFQLQREHPSAEQGGASETDYGFFLSQARFNLRGEWNELRAKLSFDLGDAIRPRATSAGLNRPPYLRDARLTYRVHKAFRLRAGRFKRPFSGLELTGARRLPFRGRGLGNDLIVEKGQWGDRALGLMVYGQLPGKLRYYLSASNPTWAHDGDLEDNGIDVIGRLRYEPVKPLTLGVSGGHKLQVRPDGEVNANAVGVDAALKLGRFDVAVDAMLAQLPNQRSADGTGTPLAYTVVGYASYRVRLADKLSLEPTLVGEYADSDAEFSRTEALRMVAGVNLRLGKRFRVMPQVELIRPLGTASAFNPWSARERYYVMFMAQL